jgi:hypothetical protein
MFINVNIAWALRLALSKNHAPIRA